MSGSTFELVWKRWNMNCEIRSFVLFACFFFQYKWLCEILCSNLHFCFNTSLRLLHPWRTPSEACIHPCHPTEFRSGWRMPCLPGFTLHPSDNTLCSCVLSAVHRGCDQDVWGEPSLSTLSWLYQPGCVGRGSTWSWGYGWSRWVRRVALKFKGKDTRNTFYSNWQNSRPVIGRELLLMRV